MEADASASDEPDTPMPFWQLHYHLIWSTYRRLPLITPALEGPIYGTLLNKAQELAVIVHAIGHSDDHIHLVVSIPPKLALAECVRQFKGASAYHVNHLPDSEGNFGWQAGYGALSFGPRSMERIVDYVKNQATQHAQHSTVAIYERMEGESSFIAGSAGAEAPA